jgi:predicted metal-dependent hydrolase
MNSEEPEKSFLQALIQLASAFHHLQNNNSQGAVSLLMKAQLRLELCPALFEGVEVTLLRAEVSTWLQLLKLQDVPVSSTFPQIRLINLSN